MNLRNAVPILVDGRYHRQFDGIAQSGDVLRIMMYNIGVQGWTGVIASIHFIGGLLLANMGVIGLHLDKIFNEVKRRPLYVIHETLNLHQPNTILGTPAC
jgi:hypothetical protein